MPFTYRSSPPPPTTIIYRYRTLSFLVSRVAWRFLMDGFVSKARFRRFFFELAMAAAAATPTGPAHNPRQLVFFLYEIFFVGYRNFFRRDHVFMGNQR
jgi:hypothetical protein